MPPRSDVVSDDIPEKVLRTYLTLTLLSTLAASFIWGVNTLFLLDAGFSNAQAFTVNAFFTAGQVLFGDSNRCGRRHAGPQNIVSIGSCDVVRLDAAVRLDVADFGAIMGLGRFLGPDRSRIHFLLRGG